MINFNDVTIRYAPGHPPVLDAVSFRIADGDLCLVVGRTGSGKSTLLSAINGLVPHFTGGILTGQVTVNGRDTRYNRPRDLADVVGWVPQNPVAGFVTDRVEDEIAYGMEQLGVRPTAMRKRVEETLDVMGIADLRHRPLTELSGGQQQRVAIAAVLAAQPRILILDEPTSALDPTAAQDVLGAITTLVHEVGLTVVLSEHRLERVMHAADQMLWLPGDGQVLAGPAAEILMQSSVTPPLTALAHRLGWATSPLSVREARRRVAAEPGLIPPDDARTRGTAPNGTANQPASAVSVSELVVRYGTTVAVNGVQLELSPGKTTAIMGRNGAGKSSLLWAIAGAVKSSGQLTVSDADPRTMNPDKVRRLVSLVPQNAPDLLYLPTVERELQQADLESSAAPGTAAGILGDLDVELDHSQDPRDLSEGQRLALVLAIQLTARPAVLLLDEPTRGLDYAMKARLARMVAGFTAADCCVVISTHDVEFVAKVAQRTVLMGEGDIVADGPTREVCTSSAVFSPQIAKVFHPAGLLTVDELPGPSR